MMPRKNKNARNMILTKRLSARVLQEASLKAPHGRPPEHRISFVIPGRPVPAVRMTTRSKKINKKALRYLAYKDEVGWRARQVFRAPFVGSVAVEINIYLTNDEDMDVDNVEKSILDGMNMIAYIDDRQVKELHGYKHVAESERAEVAIWPINDR